ncbi:MAG: beta-ketoacyl-ACP synthase II [Candidatus Dormibacteria bacterium]
MTTQVCVTGMGAITPLGHDLAETWGAMVEGVSGVATVASFDPEGLATTIAAEVKHFDAAAVLGRKAAHRMARFSQFAMVASQEAVAHAGLDIAKLDSERAGVLIASGVGGLAEIENATRTLDKDGPRRVSPLVIPMMIGDMASGNVAIEFGLRGPNFGLVSACASGAHALGEAAEIIRRGDADVMLAGGAEAAITKLAIAAFVAARTLSSRNAEPERASRPFDVARDGFVIGEGAAVLVLESLDHALARGAVPLAILSGYAASADAYHITAPDPDGRGATTAMRGALSKAALAPADVGYINAHGTSTELNDRTEAKAIREVFGDGAGQVGPPVSSTKSMTGHLLGAAGALEAVVCVKAIETSQVPATINLEEPDIDCDLDHVLETRRVDVANALTNSFGFGGHNATLVFSRPEAAGA